MKFCLGKLNPKVHPKTLLFDKYLTGELPLPAEKIYREYKVPATAKQMFGNDTIGDCTFAGLANLGILFTCHTGQVVIPTLDEVLEGYSAVSGYDPVTGANDNGCAMTDVLEYARTVGLGGRKILAWAQIDHTNQIHRDLGVDLFGATYLGVQLPASAQEQFVPNEECHWEVVSHSPVEGGHCIIHPGKGSEGGDYVTWANWFVKASTAWEQKYIDEEYVVITEDWIDQATQKTLGGIDLNALYADIKLL